MAVDAKKVKELREMTQAGFLDCQKALTETDGDIEAAVKILKEKGAAKAEKKAGAIATEGITDILCEGNKALIIEINSQTDFVAQNEEFVKLSEDMKKTILENDVVNVSEVEGLTLSNGKSVKEACTEATAKIGEKIGFRRAGIATKKDDQTFGLYVHHNKRYSAMVVVSGNIDSDVAKDVAMHLGAMNPKFMNKESVDQTWLEEERQRLIKQTMDEGKPAEFAEKIVNGRMSKLLAEYCLEDQPFVKEPSMTVGQYLANHNSKLLFMKRFELGEGIEKKVVDFAAEVAEQMGQK